MFKKEFPSIFVKLYALRPLVYNLTITFAILFIFSNPITSHLYLENMDTKATFHAEQNQIYRIYNDISNDQNQKIIFLGSSITREAIDCSQIDSIDYSCYNIASSSNIPYLQLIEIPIIVDTKPEIVFIEISPNAFSNISELSKWENFEPVVELRLGLASVLQSEFQKEMWRHNIIEDHEKYMVENVLEENLFWNNYRHTIIEEVVNSKILHNSVREKAGIHNSETINPKNPARNYTPKSEYEISESLELFYQLERFSSTETEDSINLISLMLIVDILLENNIKVILHSPPINILTINNAPEGYWDNYYKSINLLDSNYGLKHYYDFNGTKNQYSFSDLTHMDYSGRIKYTNEIISLIDSG